MKWAGNVTRIGEIKIDSFSEVYLVFL